MSSWLDDTSLPSSTRPSVYEATCALHHVSAKCFLERECMHRFAVMGGHWYDQWPVNELFADCIARGI